MPEHVESVNGIAAFFRDQIKDAGPQWRDRFTRYAEQLESASDELVRLYGLTSALPPDLGNIHDLPAELLEEISVAKTDELEDQLVTVINSYGSEASLDQILVGLYRKFKVVQKRRVVQNKLYRMTMIWGVDGRKGYYTTTDPRHASPYDDDDILAGFEASSVNTEDLDDQIPF